MGYSTEFEGRIEIVPALSVEEKTFLEKFADTRRVNREQGPYFVEASGFRGQDGGMGTASEREHGVRNFNQPPAGQPTLWCQWVPSDCGGYIEWDGNEKFYSADEWMTYIMDHFLKPNARAKAQLPFLQDHICNGEITAVGESSDDHWKIVVKDNVVRRVAGKVTYGD